MQDNDIELFLKEYTGMSYAPVLDENTRLKGAFTFEATVTDGLTINDTYELEIIIPKAYPKEIPTIIETKGKIPRKPDNHIDINGVLCLGSGIALLLIIENDTSFLKYIKKCLIPYLYAITLKLKYNENFIFGELEHGNKGLFDDYKNLFQVDSNEKVITIIEYILSKPSKIVNMKCPCGCGRKVKYCQLHHTIKHIKKVISKKWLENHYTQLTSEKN
jgi:hypothetical protein